MREAGRVEPAADRPHHAVHHAAGGDHVGPGPGVDHGLPGEQLQRGVVVDVHPAGDSLERPAMAVVGVLAEADVGDHQQLRRGLLGDPDRLLHDPVVARAADARGVLVLGDAEEDDPRDAQFGDLGDLSPSRSSESWYLPGIEAISRRRFLPW